MQYFSHRFPEVGPAETRCVVLDEGSSGLKAGKYAFMELYCDDLHCDCRKVVIEVFLESEPEMPLALINFGWESAEFYRRKEFWGEMAWQELKNGSLDPVNPQSRHA